MDCLTQVILITTTQITLSKNYKNKPPIPVINPEADLKVKKNISIFVPYSPILNEEFRRLIYHTNVKVIPKGTNNLKSILMHLKDKSPRHLKQNILHKLSCPKESWSHSYTGESSRCLEYRVKNIAVM